MNSRHRNDDEASFEGLVSFDTVPPPKGEGPDDLHSDVHSACTAVAQLPDSFLEELKSGVKADVSRLGLNRKSLAASPLIPREEPDEVPHSDLVATRKAHAFELPEAPTSPYGAKILGDDPTNELARAAAAIRTPPPELPAPPPPPAPPPSPEPYAPAPSYTPSRPSQMLAFVAPARPPSERPAPAGVTVPSPLVVAAPPAERPSFVERLWAFRRSIDVRAVLMTVGIVILFAILLVMWAMLLKHLV